MLRMLVLLLGVDAGSDSPVLERAYAEDQADRTPGADWKVVNQRDAERRRVVQRELDEKRVRTALDFYRAAMVFQHGPDAGDALLARDLAGRSVQLDGSNKQARWLAAAATDRWLMRQNKPQQYGTQFVKSDGVWVLYPVDDSITDAQRAEYHVPTLAEARRRAEKMNAPPPVDGGPAPR